MTENRQLLMVNGQQLEYQRLGNPGQASATLIFLHEGLGCIDLWKGFPAQLCQQTGLPGLVYSRAGYGGSSPLSGARRVNFMHDEALLYLGPLLDQLNISRAILVGHSDGASIAIIYAGATKDPRLEGLVLLAPHLFVEKETLTGIEIAKQNYLQGRLKQQLERYHGSNVEGAFWGWNDIWLQPDFQAWDIQEYVPQIEVPTLAIQGLDDQYGTLLQISRLKAALKVAFVQSLLPDCGHSPHLEKSIDTLDAITAFTHDLGTIE